MLPPFKISPTIAGPRAAATGVTQVSSGSTSKFASTLASKKDAAAAASSTDTATAAPAKTKEEQDLQTFQQTFIQNCSILAPAEMPDPVEG